MKKFLSLLMMALLCVTTAWAESDSYSIIFGNNANSATPLTSSVNASTVINDGTNYVTSKPFTVNGGNCYYGDTQNTIRLGKSGNASSLSIALSDLGKVNATKIVVNCYNSGGKNASATLSVNSAASQTTTQNESDYIFELDGSQIASINMVASASVLVKSITVYYTKETALPAAPTASITFNPVTNCSVEVGSFVYLILNGEATGIKYTTDETDPDADNGTIGTSVMLTGNVGDQVTIKAVPYNTNSVGTTFGTTVYTATYTLKAASASSANVYQRITSTDDLVVGEKYIIVYSGSDDDATGGVMGVGNMSANTRPYISKNISNNKITVVEGDDIAQFTLGGASNGYTFMYNNKYLSGTSGETNLNINGDGSNNNSKWTITFSGNNAKINFCGQTTRYVGRGENNSIFVFKNYSGTQTGIYLYKYIGTDNSEYNINRIIQTNGESSTVGGWLGNWSENCTVGTDWQTNPAYSVTAPAGVTVQFKAGTNNNYQILAENVTAVDANNATVPLTTVSTANDGITFSFTMPASAVTITANFTSYQPDLYLMGNANGQNWQQTYKMNYDGSNTGKEYSIRAYYSADHGEFQFEANGTRYASGAVGDYWLIGENGDYAYSTEVPLYANSTKNYRLVPGIYDIYVNKDRNKVIVTPVTVEFTFTPADGSTVNQGTEVTVSSNLYSLLHAINSNVAENDVTNQVSLDNNAFNSSVTLNTIGNDKTVYGKATYGNIEVTSNASYTVAVFYNINCSVITTPSDKTGGAITSDKQTATAGETVTLTITTNAGYELDCVKLNGTAITGNTFEMPAADANVVAYFNAKTLNITVNNDDAKGVVSEIPATSTVSSEIEFTVTPHTGYTVNSVTCTFTPDGGNPSNLPVTAGENNTYSFKMPGYDVTIDVTYDEVIEGLIDPLFHETFGTNPGSNREWSDNYSVKSGVEAVYSGITSYTVNEYVRQGSTNSGIEDGNAGLMGVQDNVASIIMGPLNVADYQSLLLTYQWKAGSIKKTYYTKAFYATSATGTYSELTGTGNGATTYVTRSYTLPAAAEVSTLYLKIEFFTSNSQPYIDEVNLSGAPKRTTLKQIEETNPAGEVTIADDLQVVAISAVNNHQVAFARDFAESINPATCPEDAVDFMRSNMVYTEADKQVGEWQQNNWVMLDFGDVPSNKFGELEPNCVIKGGTLTGTYSDYTFSVNNGFAYEEGPAVDDYTPNVYSPANFYVVVDENTTPPTYTPTYIQTFNGDDYWFMTPKPMEVCKFTWAMYYNKDGYAQGFYMQDGDTPLKGGVGVDLDYNTKTANLVDGASYRFTGVIMKTGQRSGAKDDPNNHHPQTGSTLNPNFKVAAVDLDTSEGSEQIITGVNEVKTGSDVVSVTYCDLAGRMSQKPFAGVNIIVTRYSDGTVKTTKAIK